MTVSLSLCESFSSLGAPRAAPPRFRTLTTLSHYCARHPPPSVPTQASAQTSLYLHHSIYLTPELRFIVVTLQNPESIELVGIGDNLSRQSFPWARANDKVARVNGHVQEAASEREREGGSWRVVGEWDRKGGLLPCYITVSRSPVRINLGTSAWCRP